MSDPEKLSNLNRSQRADVMAGPGLPEQLYEAAVEYFEPGIVAPDPYRRYAITDKGAAVSIYRQLGAADPSRASIKCGSIGCEYEYILDMYPPGNDSHPLSLVQAKLMKDGIVRASLDRGFLNAVTNSYHVMPVEGETMMLAGSGLLKTLQAARPTTKDNYLEVKQRHPSTEIQGREAKMFWESVQPVADLGMDFRPHGRPGPEDTLCKIWQVMTVYDSDLIVRQLIMRRHLSYGRDITTYAAKLLSKELAEEGGWLRVNGMFDNDMQQAAASYDLISQQSTKMQPFYLGPSGRMEVYEAIDRHIYPENLFLLYMKRDGV